MNVYMGWKARNLADGVIVLLGQEINTQPRLVDRQPSIRGGVLPVETRSHFGGASAGLA
jgi:hypothetical protein